MRNQISGSFVVLALVVGLVLSLAGAQALAAPQPPSPYSESCPQPNPYATPSSAAPRTLTSQEDPDRAEHLRLAVEHLRAAGCTQWAQRIVDELLIEAKLEQIRQLQKEVEQLRSGDCEQQLTLLGS